jgi:hypothetical protein
MSKRREFSVRFLNHLLFSGEAATLIATFFWKLAEFFKQRIVNCKIVTRGRTLQDTKKIRCLNLFQALMFLMFGCVSNLSWWIQQLTSARKSRNFGSASSTTPTKLQLFLISQIDDYATWLVWFHFGSFSRKTSKFEESQICICQDSRNLFDTLW